ncbi:MAG: hypothetical protein ACR2I0_10745 [Rhodoferax sp.]
MRLYTGRIDSEIRQWTMVEEQVYFWQIQWAGRWMTSSVRYSEKQIRQTHPEAIRIDESRQVRITPETPEEVFKAQAKARTSSPDVRYETGRKQNYWSYSSATP